VFRVTGKEHDAGRGGSSDVAPFGRGEKAGRATGKVAAISTTTLTGGSEIRGAIHWAGSDEFRTGSSEPMV